MGLKVLAPSSEGVKTCTRCKVEKPLGDFPKRKERPLGVASQCNQCKKEKRIERVYGLTPKEYQELLISQDYSCGACGKHVSEQYLCVDHDHDTDEVRGLLCDNCNKGLGLIGDNLEAIERIADYLRGRHAK